MPQGDALRKRLLLIHFSYGDKIPRDRQEQFKQVVEPRLSLLQEIGTCISHLLVSGNVSIDVLDQDPLVAGEQLLAKCYELAELRVPDWLKLRYEEKETVEESIVEEFIERFKKLVHDSFARYISRVVIVDSATETEEQVKRGETTLEERVRVLVRENMLPGVRLVKDRMVITQQLLRELELDGRISLKSLSELLGWNYGAVRVGDKVVKAAIAKVDGLLDLLRLAPDDPNQDERTDH